MIDSSASAMVTTLVFIFVIEYLPGNYYVIIDIDRSTWRYIKDFFLDDDVTIYHNKITYSLRTFAGENGSQ